MAIDYTKFGPTGPAGDDGKPIRKWWKLDESELSESIVSTVHAIKRSQTGMETQRQIAARLYGNLSLLNISGLTFTRSAQASTAVRDRVTYNVISSVIDTITAKIAKNRPKPLFLTSGGDFKAQRKAKLLNKFTEGIFYENNVKTLGPQAFRDGAIWGTGPVKVVPDNGRVKFERTLSSELYVDDIDGFYGSPRQMHHVKPIDRDVLIECWPKKADEVLAALAMPIDQLGGAPLVSDQIPVIESWHLPSGPKAKDGRHVISIADVILLDEPWTRNSFPFAFFHWSRRVFGFWGQGIPEQIQNIQLEINKLLWVIQRSMHLMGSFKIWLPHDAKTATEHLNNDIGTIIRGTTPPQYLVPAIVPAEMYQHLATLRQSAYEQCGVSQLSAAAKKPEGLDSGKALREYNDIESDRFQIVGQAYEEFHLDLARLAIETAKEIAEREGEFKVKAPMSREIREIKWSEVALPDDSYILQCYPISHLPQDPAGRLQTVQEEVQAGFYDARTAKRLLEFPDLEMVDSLTDAVEERILKVLDAIVDDGKSTPPDPMMDLGTARKFALQYYNRGAIDGLDEERMELLRTWLDQIMALEMDMQPPAPAGPPPDAAAAPPMQPLAAPAGPPVSDLVPQQNAIVPVQ